MGTVVGTGPLKEPQAGKLVPTAVSATTSNSSPASVRALNASLDERAHRNDTARRHGTMSSSELEMRQGREPQGRHARDYEERLHDRWKAEDRLREETNRPHAERPAHKEEELASANESTDGERRYRLDELHRSEEKRLRAEEECRRETQDNR